MITIAIDGEGGDHASKTVFEALTLTYNQWSNVLLKVFCYQENANIFKQIPNLEVIICPTNENGTSTMQAAIHAVKNKEAQACVSAGNTIFYLLESLKTLDKLHLIRRPALISSIPSEPRDKVLVDIGANLQASAMEMAMFAVMGKTYAKYILKRENPKVSFLNVGSETIKGPLYIREAKSLYNQIIKDDIDQTDIAIEADFIEGDQVFSHDTDIVVMDGFTGNILLKFAEGLAKFFFRKVKENAYRSFKNRIAALFAKPLFKGLSHLNPEKYNSAILMGVDGLVVKAHGNSNGVAFASSIKYAVEMCEVNDQIISSLVNFSKKIAQSSKI